MSLSLFLLGVKGCSQPRFELQKSFKLFQIFRGLHISGGFGKQQIFFYFQQVLYLFSYFTTNIHLVQKDIPKMVFGSKIHLCHFYIYYNIYLYFNLVTLILCIIALHIRSTYNYKLWSIFTKGYLIKYSNLWKHRRFIWIRLLPCNKGLSFSISISHSLSLSPSSLIYLTLSLSLLFFSLLL